MKDGVTISKRWTIGLGGVVALLLWGSVALTTNPVPRPTVRPVHLPGANSALGNFLGKLQVQLAERGLGGAAKALQSRIDQLPRFLAPNQDTPDVSLGQSGVLGVRSSSGDRSSGIHILARSKNVAQRHERLMHLAIRGSDRGDWLRLQIATQSGRKMPAMTAENIGNRVLTGLSGQRLLQTWFLRPESGLIYYGSRVIPRKTKPSKHLSNIFVNADAPGQVSGVLRWRERRAFPGGVRVDRDPLWDSIQRLPLQFDLPSLDELCSVTMEEHTRATCRANAAF